jgi:hypothetical protein
VGDVIECFFHNMGNEKIPARVKRFVKQSGMPLDVTEKFAEVIAFSTQIETQLECQVAVNPTPNDLAQRMGITLHMWLRNYRHLGVIGAC